MVEPELIRYRSADGRIIPAFLYRPHDLAEGQRVPVVLGSKNEVERVTAYHLES